MLLVHAQVLCQEAELLFQGAPYTKLVPLLKVSSTLMPTSRIGKMKPFTPFALLYTMLVHSSSLIVLLLDIGYRIES